MSMVRYGRKDGAFRIHNGVAGNPPKTLLTLYQRKDFDIARVGAPSPLADPGVKRDSS